MYNFDLASFYEKWADDIRIDSGYRWSDIAPGGGSGDVSPEWQGAICFVPWQAYLFTGDTTLLRENYTAMKKVFAAMRAEMSDNTITSYWGDHIAQNSNIPCISGTAHVYYMAYILSQAAKLVGYPNESATYAAEAQTIKDAFNAKFYNTSLGYYCEPDSLKFYQGAQALPIAFGMVPDEYLANLCTKLGTLSTSYETGIYSTKHIFNILTQSGYGDVAYNMVNTTSYPGWGNIISQGATALWERWEQSTRSRSHQMFGTIDEWFYRSIIGINSDGAGFSKITIKPYAVGDLTWASGSTETVRGKISSSWTKAADDTFTLNVTIPANTTATVYVPAANAADVTESGISAANAEGVELLRSENGFAVFSVGSGSYSFKSVYTAPTVDSTEYKITVTDGKASVGAGNEISTAIAGTSVTLTADTAPAGKMFEKWEIISGNVTLTSPNQNPTEFIMPNADVEIKAIYQDISASHTHDYKNLKYNRDNCWLECDCGVKQNESPHTDNDGDGTCDICGLPIPSTATQSPLTGHFAKTLPWIFALSVLSLSGGIASLCVTLRKRRA